ncbi:MAG TPA: GAF domain-containing protein [Thermoanaerobaculia bacterium]|jgi:GAF domain-containing protein|nr:GAF domain-containing protein [Thermoanaerobaculia bacterium]
MSDPRAEKFLELFNKGKEFTEELLRENERLRYRIASMEERFREIVEENKDFAGRYAEIEEQNNNLASLYVASYQLHSTLDFREVIQIVQEIIVNLIGAKSFAIALLDENTNELRTIAWEGEDVMPGVDTLSVSLGAGVIGGVAASGESWFLREGAPSLDRPLAAVPLKIKDQSIGVIAVYNLLVQKEAFTAVDYELFALLAAHASTAIFSSKLFAQSERRLNTIQSFLDLLTTS